MKILIVTHSLPYPLTYGAAVRVYNFIKYLSRSNSVTLLAFKSDSDSAEDLQHVRSICHDVILVDHHISCENRRLRQLRSIFTSASSFYYEYYCPNFQAKLDELLSSQQFDCVQLEFSFMAYYKLKSKAYTCLDEHNVEFNIHYRSYQQERNPAIKLYKYLEYKKVRAEEIAVAGNFDRLFYPSQVDADTMRSHVKPEISVVPNGVDTDSFLPADSPVDGPFFYFGAMNYAPNIDGVSYFLDQIWPKIRARRPSARFEVVGPHPPESIKKHSGANGVLVRGEVPNIRSAIESAGVVVVPLRIGSGTRLKILESLAMGKAIVSTSIGCEGIDVVNQKHLTIADDPAEFAECCLQLESDTSLRKELGVNGRRLVEQNYSWQSICNELQNIYESAR